MEGFPLALVAENTPVLELLVGGDLECILGGFSTEMKYDLSAGNICKIV